MKKAIWLAVLYTAVMGAGKAYVKTSRAWGTPTLGSWNIFLDPARVGDGHRTLHRSVP